VPNPSSAVLANWHRPYKIHHAQAGSRGLFFGDDITFAEERVARRVVNFGGDGIE
jgi:hypothetical protein